MFFSPLNRFGYFSSEMTGTYVNATTKERTTTKFEFLPSGYRFTKGERKRLFDPELFE
jgi:hypothetical protein